MASGSGSGIFSLECWSTTTPQPSTSSSQTAADITGMAPPMAPPMATLVGPPMASSMAPSMAPPMGLPIAPPMAPPMATLMGPPMAPPKARRKARPMVPRKAPPKAPPKARPGPMHGHRRDRTRSRSPHMATRTKHTSATSRAGTSGNRTKKDNCDLSILTLKHKNCRNPIDKDGVRVTRSKHDARRIIYDIHERITVGFVTFGDAAFTFSETPSARFDGVIHDPILYRTVYNILKHLEIYLAPGQMSKVIESKSGFHIIKRRAKVAPATPRPDELKCSGSPKPPSEPTQSDAVASTSTASATSPPVAREAHHRGPQKDTTSDKFTEILIKHKDCSWPFDSNKKPVTRTKDEAMELANDIHKKIKLNVFTFADAEALFSDFGTGQHDVDQDEEKRKRKLLLNLARIVRPGRMSHIAKSQAGFHIFYRNF